MDVDVHAEVVSVESTCLKAGHCHATHSWLAREIRQRAELEKEIRRMASIIHCQRLEIRRLLEEKSSQGKGDEQQ